MISLQKSKLVCVCLLLALVSTDALVPVAEISQSSKLKRKLLHLLKDQLEEEKQATPNLKMKQGHSTKAKKATRSKTKKLEEAGGDSETVPPNERRDDGSGSSSERRTPTNVEGGEGSDERSRGESRVTSSDTRGEPTVTNGDGSGRQTTSNTQETASSRVAGGEGSEKKTGTNMAGGEGSEKRTRTNVGSERSDGTRPPTDEGGEGSSEGSSTEPKKNRRGFGSLSSMFSRTPTAKSDTPTVTSADGSADGTVSNTHKTEKKPRFRLPSIGRSSSTSTVAGGEGSEKKTGTNMQMAGGEGSGERTGTYTDAANITPLEAKKLEGKRYAKIFLAVCMLLCISVFMAIFGLAIPAKDSMKIVLVCVGFVLGVVAGLVMYCLIMKYQYSLEFKEMFSFK